RSFDFETLRAASGRSEDETLLAIEELVERRLIRELEEETFDFEHAQLRTVVYQGVGMTRRRLLHKRIAEALLAQQTPARHAYPLIDNSTQLRVLKVKG